VFHQVSCVFLWRRSKKIYSDDGWLSFLTPFCGLGSFCHFDVLFWFWFSFFGGNDRS
jgi:hypothetical protein